MFAKHQAQACACIGPPEGDAGRLEESQLESDVVGDDAHAVEQVEDAGAGAVQIDDEDAVAAVVDLKEPDAGAVGIEARGLGVLDLGGEPLPVGDERRDLGRRRLELARAFSPRHLRLRLQ